MITIQEFFQKYGLRYYLDLSYSDLNKHDLFFSLKRNKIPLDEDIIISMINDEYYEVLSFYESSEKIIDAVLNCYNGLNKIDFIEVFKRHKITIDYALKRKSSALWEIISMTQPHFLSEFDSIKHYLNIEKVNKYLPIDRKFIEKYPEYIDWEALSANTNKILTDQDIIDFNDKLDFRNLCLGGNLNSKILDKFSNKIDFSFIYLYSRNILSEEFIEKYINELCLSFVKLFQRCRNIIKKDDLGYKKNVLALYDLGRDDWFIGYTILDLQLPILTKKVELSELIIPTNSYIYPNNYMLPYYINKCRIYYKDLVGPLIVKKDNCQVLSTFNRCDNIRKRNNNFSFQKPTIP